ncbi:hypothetical protein CBR_g3912 [Chara braunii]|uniref:Uncharacterized protein n=1 Tax=Chara braunii TaxID=69332 RepID=A0A388KGV8_CHABU|nr:hypothetical protein CBR_g3912 [Chara braunii]|eukprot:GBG69213.1 hypothetical protein CBR_g3912 [Chara braunii]
MVDNFVTVGVVVLCCRVTVVEVVVDDVLGGGAMDVDGERSGVNVVWGEVVVMTAMAGVFPSIAVTLLEMVEMKVFISVMEVFTREMDDWRDFIIWSRAAKSGAVGVAAGWSSARLRAMLSTESVRMEDMSMLDSMVGEEVADEVAAAAEVVVTDEVEAAAAAAVLAAAASAAAAAH